MAFSAVFHVPLARYSSTRSVLEDMREQLEGSVIDEYEGSLEVRNNDELRVYKSREIRLQ